MNLLLLVLLRAWSSFVRKVRAMAEARGKRGFPLMEVRFKAPTLPQHSSYFPLFGFGDTAAYLETSTLTRNEISASSRLKFFLFDQ